MALESLPNSLESSNSADAELCEKYYDCFIVTQQDHYDGLVQERRNSSVLAMELTSFLH